MKKKILVLGYFGYLTNQLDGQTIKTRNVYRLLKSKEKEIGYVDYFDTQTFQKSKFSLLSMFWKVIQTKKLIYLPAHKNLKFIFPILFLISKIFGFEIHYIVVGGWLVEYLQIKPIHRFFLKNISNIFPENIELCERLHNEYGFINVRQFPNFRIQNFQAEFNISSDKFRIVFMARVTKLKGIDVLFELSDLIKAKSYYNDIQIDIYGPIDKNDNEYFYKNLPKHKKISYKGVIDPKDVYKILRSYDVMVLPTRYPGEGFPGSILDAYISGIPVITTKWRQIPEFVEVGKTGFIIDIYDTISILNYIELLNKDRSLLLEMKKNARNKSKEYSSEYAWEIIKPYITN